MWKFRILDSRVSVMALVTAQRSCLWDLQVRGRSRGLLPVPVWVVYGTQSFLYLYIVMKDFSLKRPYFLFSFRFLPVTIALPCSWHTSSQTPTGVGRFDKQGWIEGRYLQDFSQHQIFCTANTSKGFRRVKEVIFSLSKELRQCQANSSNPGCRSKWSWYVDGLVTQCIIKKLCWMLGAKWEILMWFIFSLHSLAKMGS